MTVHLNPHSEQLLKEQLSQGHFRSPEEVLERALESLQQKESAPTTPLEAKSAAEAVNDILELRKGVRLNGLKIKNLIHEGQRI